MAEEKTFPMTLEGKEKLEKELEELKTTKRAEIIERIKIARSFGDLSENSEYEAAKNEQSILEGRIKEVTNMLNHAEIIDNGAIAEDEVAIDRNFPRRRRRTGNIPNRRCCRIRSVQRQDFKRISDCQRIGRT